MTRPFVASSPSLFGGVSLQPSSLRFVHQVEDASNALFSVVDGVSKRPGSWYLRTITGLSTTADVREHRIIRDQGERYIAVYGKDTTTVLRLFELGRPEATVRITDDALAYLNANNPTADQLRLVSEVDATFILNITVTLGTIQGITYVVSGVWSTYEIMVANVPASGTYHQTLTSTTGHDAGYWRYTGGTGGLTTLAKIVFAPVTGTFLAVPSGFWDNSGQGPWGFKMGFKRRNIAVTAGTWTAAAKTLVQTGAFIDYVWNEGESIYIGAGTAATPGWYAIVSRDSDDQITLATSIGADNADTVATGIGVEALVSYPRDTTTLASMEDVAAKLTTLLTSGGAPGALCAWTDTGHPGGFGSPALLRGYFTITSPYGGNEATITTPTPPGSGTDWSAAGWPFTASTSTVTTGSGTSGGTPAWDSVAAPDATSDIDPTKMPVRMTRTAVSNGTNPAVFDVDVVDWNVRESGDDTTNPIPTPWTTGLRARDLCFYQDRFVFAAGEFLVMSAAGDYYNFFLADYLNLVDSDPVIVPLSSEEITVIDYITPYQKSLGLITLAGRQYQAGFTDVLKPGSVAITAATNYTTLSIRPKVMGARLYFIGIEGYGTQVLEYGFDDQAVTGDAANITGHVPGYVPATIRTLETSQNNQMALILPTAEVQNTIYVYKTFWSKDQKQQSAWDTYDFDTGCFIADIVVIEDYCYVLVKKDKLWAMERFSLPQEPKCVPLETVQ